MMATGEDIEKIRMVADAELLAEGLITLDGENNTTPTEKGLREAMKYWDTLTPKQKMFTLWVMQTYFKDIVGGSQ